MAVEPPYARSTSKLEVNYAGRFSSDSGLRRKDSLMDYFGLKYSIISIIEKMNCMISQKRDVG